ncbi:MAG: hypothetical protein V4560_00055 [Bacteroidota bacterium]
MKNYLNPIVNRLAVCSFILFAGMTLKDDQVPSSPTAETELIKGLKPLAPFVNKEKCAISVLYGNEIIGRPINGSQKSIEPGEILTLLTWKGQSDENWIGANIPGELLTAELLRSSRAANGKVVFIYQRLSGPNLSLIRDTTGNAARISWISHLDPAILP